MRASLKWTARTQLDRLVFRRGADVSTAGFGLVADALFILKGPGKLKEGRRKCCWKKQSVRSEGRKEEGAVKRTCVTSWNNGECQDEGDLVQRNGTKTENESLPQADRKGEGQEKNNKMNGEFQIIIKIIIGENWKTEMDLWKIK